MPTWIPKDGEKCIIVDILDPDAFVSVKDQYIGKVVVCASPIMQSKENKDCLYGYFRVNRALTAPICFANVKVRPISTKILIFNVKKGVTHANI